jgi:hypothetical protein
MAYKVQHEDILNLEKPTRFCSMTFLVNKIEIGGITSSLQAIFGNAKKKNFNFEYLDLDFEHIQISDTVYYPLVLCVQVRHH